MTNSATTIMAEIGRAFRALVQFLVVLVLMVVLALLRVLPVVLRALALIAWIAGIGFTGVATFALYSQISINLIGNALVCVMFAAIVAVIPALFDFGDAMWGGYAFAALFGYGVGTLAGALVARPDLYPLLALVPNALAVTGVIALAGANRKIDSDSLEEENYGEQIGSD